MNSLRYDGKPYQQFAATYRARKPVRVALTVLIALLYAKVPSVGAGDTALILAVAPSQSFAPATVSVRLTIEPSIANRRVAVTVDSEDFYRSSEIPLDADHAPRI